MSEEPRTDKLIAASIQWTQKIMQKIDSILQEPKAEYKLSTDGACIGNPGPGGWACVLRVDGHVDELFGCAPHTTNSRMELQAVIEGLKSLNEPCSVAVSTDSQYVQLGITKWVEMWKAAGWRRSDRRAVLNQDLWRELDERIALHTVRWKWVKGHADDPDNLRCHHLANRAARQQISSSGSRSG